jgi:OOP family OmpA-OmpF porin
MRAISIGTLAFALILAGCAHTRMDEAPIAAPVVEPVVELGVLPVTHYDYTSPYVLPNILFVRDSLTVKSHDYPAVLEGAVRELQKWYRDTVVLEGHTCDIGDENYNQQLGLRRAQVVFDQLIAMGIARERLSIRSHGESTPAVRNVEPDRALNRRVVLKFSLGEYSKEEEQAIKGK